MFGTARWTGMGALVLLSGCFGRGKLTDTDPNPLEASDAAPTLDGAELGAEDFAAVCNVHDYELLMASSPSPGRIDVEHRGLDLDCGTWSADATVDGDTISIEYVSAEDTTTGCSCNWTFTYSLPVERAGTFTIEAGGDTVDVEVR